ncbi:MAG TPA: DUF167 domain-containing protein [Bryobacteraceae bacterium]|nr:DUF167 domain-containing protein [Bryobacteraceae bacterium]
MKQQLERDGRLLLHVKAQPKASRDGVVGWMEDGALKVKVTAAPDRGKANAAICRLLAEWLDVPPSHVRVVRGETSPQKLIEVVR